MVEKEPFEVEIEALTDGEKLRHALGLTAILQAWTYIDDALLDGNATIQTERTVVVTTDEGRRIT